MGFHTVVQIPSICFFVVFLRSDVKTTDTTQTSSPRTHGAVAYWHMRVAAVCPGPGIMATYVEILKSEFPEIDSELFDYITGERPGLELPCAGVRAAVLPVTERLSAGCPRLSSRPAKRFMLAFNQPVSRGANKLTG